MASTLKVNEIQHTGGTTAFTIDSDGRMLKGTGGNLPAFRAYPTSNFYTKSGAYTLLTDSNLIFGGATYNYGGHYNTSTGRFVAPVTGLYQFTSLMAMGANSNTYVYLSAEVIIYDGTSNTQNGRWVGGWGHKTGGTNYYDRQINVQTIPMTAGDSATIGYECSTVSVPVLGNNSKRYTYFAGHLIG